MVRIGIIGSGFGLYGHLPAFKTTARCQVVAICGKESDRLSRYCKSIGLNKIYTDWREMLAREKLDAISIAVTPHDQYEIAKFAIDQVGLHIFAEKPLAKSLKEAQQLLALAQTRKIKHMVDFLFPEIGEWKKVKQLLDKKTYGRLKQICLNWDFQSYDIKNKKKSWKTDVNLGGGALSLFFCHSLYYLENFAGEISDLKSLLSYSGESMNGGETGVDLLLKFENNITGYAHLSANSEGLNRHQLKFICERATLILENEGSYTSNFTIKVYTNRGLKQLVAPVEKDRVNEDERVKTVRKLTTRFINSIIDNRQAVPSFREGVKVQQLIEKIRRENE